MEVKHLSIETIEDLCHALEKPTLNWEELMRSNTFAAIYSENDINKIRMTGCSPAKALIDDLVLGEIPLRVLLRGLTEIGNKKAISIIKRDMMSKGCNIEDSGGRPLPPPYNTRQPEEVMHFSTSLATWALQPTTVSNNCYCVYE
ncbi:Nuclear factorNF-kappa-B p105 subunit [Porites harrisoni]